MPRVAKTIVQIESLARVWTETMVNVLSSIAMQKTAPQAARVSAAVALLDRGWGKPAQKSDVTVRRIIAREIADDELAYIAAGSSDGAAETPVDPSQLN